MLKKLNQKKRLLTIHKKYENKEHLTPNEIKAICEFSYHKKKSKFWSFVKKATLPLSIFLGALIAIFPEEFEDFTANLPTWTNFSEKVVLGLDYIWNIIGEPVGRSNIIYHLPNIILYAFGFIGLKAIFDAITKEKWQDKILRLQKKLNESIEKGDIKLTLKDGFSILFTGGGDFIGEQYDKNQSEDMSITIASLKPSYTNIWNYYDVASEYANLSKVLKNINAANAGEYVFFPVKDDQIFLPNLKAYDLSPHKLELIIKNIRAIEKENSWSEKRIVIIGDKFQKSTVRSEDNLGKIKDSEEIISLLSISKKYENVLILDPSEIVLTSILYKAQNRKIIFRASADGMNEYKNRFFYRLNILGYDYKTTLDEDFIIGYDLFEDQVEQQSLNRISQSYYPVVLSRSVYEALLRNGYKEEEFLYVPKIVLDKLNEITKQQ